MSKTSPVAVAGAGIISAIGGNIRECLWALENGRAGMDDITFLDTVYRRKIPVAEVKASNTRLEELAGGELGVAGREARGPVSRTALLSYIAAREALGNAAIPEPDRWRAGMVSATTVGGMDLTEGFFARGQRGRLREIVQHECGYSTEWVADQLGLRHYQTTISTACSSSANAIGFAAKLIRHGILDVVVAGGTDALTKFTLNGFNALMILDPAWCKPFDAERQGLNLGEGAGYVVLVSDAVAATLPSRIECVLSGYANANDAFHQTASSPDGRGSWLAMRMALERSGLQPSDIDYINLHGTGTLNNDLAEGTAIRRLFDPRYPKMSSTKSFTGHTLGASGGIEAVFSVLAVRYGLVYPNLRFHTPMPELPFVPETEFASDLPIRHVLSNSFGFGGNCSSLVFSKS
ncbi:MAG TPA: beta-ketoacyl-[acyl-carrier-protein] synthase family protein [Puia sp.]|jgi:3-oxoacyl-[acyl-carrier-protein] synthase-1|nr:beta-ketoacyl-[acyl-carrier-protein] synthase family protein [Puia sp.]